MKNIVAIAVAGVLLAASGSVDDASFKAPPRRFAPHVWWHWMKGNISKEGITADLEALADVGRISLANGSPYSYNWLVPQTDIISGRTVAFSEGAPHRS